MGVILAAILMLSPAGEKNIATSQNSPEIEKILELRTTSEKSDELLRLLDRVGPLEAQEELLKSGMPFTGETHLLVHTIGDYIYDKEGLDGLQDCRDYFLSACYHGFIINALADHGLEGVADAIDRCKEAAPGVFPQCSHAAGHGFLAWQDYDLTKALEMCDTLGESVEDFAYFNCYDGTFMENMWGIHSGAPSEKRWVSETDIYYPCTDKRISEKYLGGCWSNQATLIYQHYKGDLRKTALACDEVVNDQYKGLCYNNLFRQIHPMTNGDIDKVFSMCSVSTGKSWQDECVLTNMISYWSVGDHELPFEICDAILNSEIKSSCFDRLVGVIGYTFGREPEEKRLACEKISSSTHKERCLRES